MVGSPAEMALEKQSNGGYRAEELGRRQFQRASVEIIKLHEGALMELREKLRINSEFMADQSVRIDGHSSDLARIETNLKLDVAELRGRLTGFRSRGFIDRFMWLLFGR